MVLVGLLVSVFLLYEARRYRYFNVWLARARLLETDFYAPMIRGEGIRLDSGWTELLAKDYREPRYHPRSEDGFAAHAHGSTRCRWSLSPISGNVPAHVDPGLASEESALLGTPEEIIARLKKLEAGGVDYVLLVDPTGSKDNLRTFAEEIMPAFADAPTSMPA